MRIAANPILARELRERMRSMRAPVIISAYLLLLGLIVMFTERGLTGDENFAVFRSATAGRSVFHFLTFFLVMFLCFMVPAFSSSAISAERERQTLHLVQVTLMSPLSIVMGKLGAAAAYLGLLVLATIPLVSVSFILGGVTVIDVVRAYAMILFVGLSLSIYGVAVSARTRRTLGSTVLAFGVVGALTIGTVIGYGSLRAMQLRDGEVSEPPTWILVFNPFTGTASAISDGDTRDSASPWDGIAAGVRSQEAIRRTRVFEDGVVQEEQVAGPVDPDEPNRFWMKTVATYLLLDLIALWFAVASVRAPSHRIRIGRRRKGSVMDS